MAIHEARNAIGETNRQLTDFSDERTGPAGDECACLPRWIDDHEAGRDRLMCFPCFQELRRRRREIDRLADHYPESRSTRGGSE